MLRSSVREVDQSRDIRGYNKRKDAVKGQSVVGGAFGESRDVVFGGLWLGAPAPGSLRAA